MKVTTLISLLFITVIPIDCKINFPYTCLSSISRIYHLKSRLQLTFCTFTAMGIVFKLQSQSMLSCYMDQLSNPKLRAGVIPFEV